LAPLQYDDEAHALYIQLKKGRVKETDPLTDSILLDLDNRGNALGVEILLPKTLGRREIKPLISKRIEEMNVRPS